MNNSSAAALAVIGAGQLGSRHLQSLARLGRPLDLAVVEPDAGSAERARQRLAETGLPVSASFHGRVEDLPRRLDLVVVATTADVREALVEKLLQVRRPRFLILEKVVFQRPGAFARVAELMKTAGTRAWVNCPRRMWPFYRALRGRLKPGEPVDYHVSGSQLGVGSNAIHPLDHLAFLSGETSFRVSAEGLDPAPAPSKRPGFVEFTGCLAAFGRGGSRLSMVSLPFPGVPPLISLASPSLRAVIREAEGKAWVAEAARGWAWQEETFAVPPQSELTHLAASDLLDRGDCALTPYEESAALHLPLLEALLEHLRRAGRPAEACPIT